MSLRSQEKTLRYHPLDVTYPLKCNTPQFCHGQDISFVVLKNNYDFPTPYPLWRT